MSYLLASRERDSKQRRRQNNLSLILQALSGVGQTLQRQQMLAANQRQSEALLQAKEAERQSQEAYQNKMLGFRERELLSEELRAEGRNDTLIMQALINAKGQDRERTSAWQAEAFGLLNTPNPTPDDVDAAIKAREAILEKESLKPYLRDTELQKRTADELGVLRRYRGWIRRGTQSAGSSLPQATFGPPRPSGATGSPGRSDRDLSSDPGFINDAWPTIDQLMARRGVRDTMQSEMGRNHEEIFQRAAQPAQGIGPVRPQEMARSRIMDLYVNAVSGDPQSWEMLYDLFPTLRPRVQDILLNRTTSPTMEVGGLGTQLDPRQH